MTAGFLWRNIMAATRLIALHLNKGRTLAGCLSDRINYAENPDKTGEGVYIKSYQCDPRTAGEEFLLSKRLYTQKTGRNYGNVIAYQIRQSFKPGEVSPEQANRIGYELAMSFTKGRHVKEAGKYLTTYLYGDYRKHDDIFRIIKEYVLSNGITVAGFAYKEAVIDELAAKREE